MLYLFSKTNTLFLFTFCLIELCSTLYSIDHLAYHNSPHLSLINIMFVVQTSVVVGGMAGVSSFGGGGPFFPLRHGTQ